MEIRPVRQATTALPIPDLPRLIETTGTSKFEKLLFEAGRGMFQCEHVTALVYSVNSVQAAIAESADSRPVAKILMSAYLDRYWKHDPVHQFTSETLANHEVYLIRTAPCDILIPEYRAECYTAARLVDRLSLLRRCGDEFIRLNIYGLHRFRDCHLEALVSASHILMPLLSKHLEIRSSHFDKGDFKDNFNRARRRLLQIEPELSDREAEICASIVSGMNAEAISLNFNISRNTVHTYRKRAYSKLQISTQNELMRLAFC